MRRVYCDGCWAHGTQTDLTGRNDYARVPFLGSRVTVLDLCPERCLPVYEQFEWRHKSETREHAAQFKKNLDALITAFWKEVSSGSPQETIRSEVNAAKSGAQIRTG